jgi:16S rRNA (guanine527-N7)-methyltransferase
MAACAEGFSLEEDLEKLVVKRGNPAKISVFDSSDFSPNERWLEDLLSPYDLRLRTHYVYKLLIYIELLREWNSHVNLVAAAPAEVWVRRHLAESLYLTRAESLTGSLLDVGSGAGFPGLPLKIVFPDLAMTLLEPIAKKRAFLKEVVRACGLAGVDVRRERVGEYHAERGFSSTSSRAVGHFAGLISEMVRLTAVGGGIFLWVSARQGLELERASDVIAWDRPLDIPGTQMGQIWRGRRKVAP